MSMKSQGRWWGNLAVAFPRMVMAVLLAVVISKPLELKIFEKEIRTELAQMAQEVFKQQDDRVKERCSSQILDLRDQIAGIKTEIAPILVKLISSRSPYDCVLHQHEHVFEMVHLEQTTLLRNGVQNNTLGSG